MGKRKPSTRVMGVYNHPHWGWRATYLVDGIQKQEYFKTKGAASARLKELEQVFKDEWAVAAMSQNKPPAFIQEAEEGREYLSRGGWLRAIWHQFASLTSIGDEKLRVEALDAMYRTYKAVKDDLRIAEMSNTEPNRPSDVSDEDLLAEIIQLKKKAGSAND